MSRESKAIHNDSRTVKTLLLVFTIIFLIPAAASAQTFNAGSSEADGALSFTCAEGGETIVWDPGGLDANDASFGHGVSGIHNEIHQHLFDLAAISPEAA